MSTFKLEVVTPDNTVLNRDVEMAICPGTEGEFGLLPNHVSLLAALKIGSLRYYQNDKCEQLFISGGFVDFNNNKCSVLAESAEKANDINIERAKAAKERAEQRLQQNSADIDTIRAEAALQRAIMRLKISNKSI